MGPRCVWWCCVLCWTCLSAVGVLRAETVHFTNSPQLIMASKNFTTYELEVPGSKPITIIEAMADPYAGGNQRIDTMPGDPEQRPDGPASTTSFRTSTGISVGRPADEPPAHSGGPRKTLYSPELLHKFLHEYSEKLRNADSLTRKRLHEITMINNLPPGVDKPSDGAGENVYQYRNKQQDAEHQGSADQSGEGPPEDEAKAEDEFVFDDAHERHVMHGAASSNKRWYQESPQQHGGHPSKHALKDHPWNVKDGWVTLEAVPWSESKVSKWQAASVAEVHKHHSGKGPATGPPHSLGNYWSDEGVSGEDPPKYKPAPSPSPSSSIGASSYFHGDAGDDYGYGNRQPANRLPSAPTDSLYNRRRPASAAFYSERPDADRGRPSPQQPPQHADGWYEQQQHEQYQPNPYDSMKAYHEHAHAGPTASPPHRDIITDGRPANFPKYGPDAPPAYATSAPPHHRGRPGTYPDTGNGEWVLISTTKGYQYPKRRQGQRAITFTPAAATATSHQTVKLTVLPMKNAVDMTTSHNGLIEVSSSTQTVEDAVKQQQQRQKNKNKRHHEVKRKKTSSTAAGQGIAGTFSVMRRDAAQDSSAVLAAVGAGMVPATMAILAPMVLGKKRK